MLINAIEQDQQQRQYALDPTQSFIVQAPAGSGKTELLIQRFLNLLSLVKKPEEILAITFTKKAANEMRSRILKALKQADEMEPESAHAKKTWTLAKKVLEKDKILNWNLINNPNQLRVQTIDSLCTYLTKQLPLLSHFGSSPDITTSPTELYQAAVHEVLKHVEENFAWSEAVSQLLIHLDNDWNKLEELLVNLLAKRDQWLPYIQLCDNDEQIRKLLESHLEKIIVNHLKVIHDLFPMHLIPELLSILLFTQSNLIDLPDTHADNKKNWLEIAQLLLTKNGHWRKRFDVTMGFPALSTLKNPQEKALHSEYRKRFSQLITELNEHENLRIVLNELFLLPEATYSDSQWQILNALLFILKIATAQLRVIFQQRGKIDFIENTQAALIALGNHETPTDLALALDYQIQHILIDEFQDTSISQFQLLEKLIAGWENQDARTLFIVGDPMQSIYRFREAEVGLFIRLWHSGIGNIKLTPLTLTVNFRSTSTLVEWNNTHFHPIFPQQDDIATGAVTFSPSVAHQVQTTHTEVEVKGFCDPNHEIIPKYLLNIIQNNLDHYPNETIAILVRSRAHLMHILPALKKSGIAYHAVEIDPLSERQHIQDLLSLTSALLHPADRIAWFSILRAPWCGLTLADLLLVAGNNPYQLIYEQLENKSVLQNLSVDGQQRIARFFPILQLKLSERERQSTRVWIESTWTLIGGPACLQDALDLEDTNAFFKLLEELEENYQAINLDLLKNKIEKLYASTQHVNTALQIMTIHSAKGLEFDSVILPYLDKKIPHNEKPLLLWSEEPLKHENILLLAPIHAVGENKNPLYEYIYRKQKIKLNYETNRLLYVAATRAKKRLYLSFNMNEPEKIESSSFLETLFPILPTDCIDKMNLDSHKEAIKPQYYLRRLTSNWVNPLKHTQVKNTAFHTHQNGFQLSNQQPKLIGTIIHKALQNIATHGLEWWLTFNSMQKVQYFKNQFQQIGILPEFLTECIDIAILAIEKTINDNRGKWILHSHTHAQSEFSISVFIENKINNLIIDRTFIDEKGVRWIIDYKTITFSQQDMNEFLIKEQEKYQEKMHLYGKAMQLIDERPIRFGLYFPILSAWREW